MQIFKDNNLYLLYKGIIVQKTISNISIKMGVLCTSYFKHNNNKN